MKKNFIARIYIKEGIVYTTAKMDETIIDLEGYIRKLCDINIDEILMIVMDEDFDNKELAIKRIKEIAAYAETDLSVSFNIERAEDVKKLVYAGCKKVILNLSKQSNWEMLEDVSNRFGKDRISVTVDDINSLGVYRVNAEKYSTDLYVFTEENTESIAALTSLAVNAYLPDVSLEKFLIVAQNDNVCGIFGEVIDLSLTEVNQIKNVCKEKGIEVNSFEAKISWDELKVGGSGLIPVITQDYRTGDVLMLAYMNKEAFEKTLVTGKMNYYSRSRKGQWEKGESSGHFQYVKALYADCDYDTILAKVSQVGVACHTGSYSCFFNEITSKSYIEKNPLKVFNDVYDVIKDRKVNPKEGSYTNYLFEKGIDKILKKVGEEASEIIIASKNPDSGEIKYEISDFLYHMMVLMVDKGITWDEITNELASRE
jgi:phosphoribosyl-ATP pyrophosphohydrolase/phosphoribosyl-AMP cyclohydrolase